MPRSTLDSWHDQRDLLPTQARERRRIIRALKARLGADVSDLKPFSPSGGHVARLFRWDQTSTRFALLGTLPPRSAPSSVDPGLWNLNRFAEFFERVYGRTPLIEIDGLVLAVDGSVEWNSKRRPGAHWDLTDGIAVFARADPNRVDPSERAIDIVGHELMHAVVEGFWERRHRRGHAAAIEEHYCDVFGALARQWDAADRGQSLTEPWLLGSDIVHSASSSRRCVRNLERGRFGLLTADDYVFGSDAAAWSTWARAPEQPPPGFPEAHDGADWRNVMDYALAGVLSRAFTIAAGTWSKKEIGLSPWDGLGQVWYETLRTGRPPRPGTGRKPTPLPVGTSAQDFAMITCEHSLNLHGRVAESRLREAWQVVQVLP